jgi:hypothetical protein
VPLRSLRAANEVERLIFLRRPLLAPLHARSGEFSHGLLDICTKRAERWNEFSKFACIDQIQGLSDSVLRINTW